MPSCESLNSSETPNRLATRTKPNDELVIQYHCTRCANLLQLDEDLLAQGCPRCGAKTFRFTNPRKAVVSPYSVTHEQEFTEDALDVVRLIQPGVYQINLSKLTGMENSNEPLVLSAKRGIFRIAFPTKE